MADELGVATAVTVDLGRSDLGLPAGSSHSAVVAAIWDDHLHGLHYAQQRGAAYLSISSGLVDVAPEVVAGAQQASASPILLASHFTAGIGVLAALHVAREFDRVDSIRIGAVLDELDAGGPAGLKDLERLYTASSAGLRRRDGVFTWLMASDAQAEVRASDGTVLPAQSVPILDVPSLAFATGAPNVRFDYALGESTGRRRGGAPSLEMRIDVEGADAAGAPMSELASESMSQRLREAPTERQRGRAKSTSRYLVHPDGQRPLTALGIALGVERLLGLRGGAVSPGIHTPESLLDPAYAVERLTELGASFVDAPLTALPG
jgi:hypothetical protein